MANRKKLKSKMAIYRKRKRTEVVFFTKISEINICIYAKMNDDFADNTTKMTYNEMCSYYVSYAMPQFIKLMTTVGSPKLRSERKYCEGFH